MEITENNEDNNIKKLTRTSSLHSISADTSNILASEGSSGNSTIFLPLLVSEPVLSMAPSVHSWYMDWRMLSWWLENENYLTLLTIV